MFLYSVLARCIPDSSLLQFYRHNFFSLQFVTFWLNFSFFKFWFVDIFLNTKRNKLWKKNHEISQSQLTFRLLRWVHSKWKHVTWHLTAKSCLKEKKIKETSVIKLFKAHLCLNQRPLVVSPQAYPTKNSWKYSDKVNFIWFELWSVLNKICFSRTTTLVASTSLFPFCLLAQVICYSNKQTKSVYTENF